MLAAKRGEKHGPCLFAPGFLPKFQRDGRQPALPVTAGRR